MPNPTPPSATLNRLLAVLMLSSFVTLFFVPWGTQVPTKWSFSGEPKQFVSAWLALLVVPFVVMALAFAFNHWKDAIGQSALERLVLKAAGIIGTVVLLACHGLIIWAAIARA